MTIKTYMTRDTIWHLIANAKKKGYTMEAINMVVNKLNIETRGALSKAYCVVLKGDLYVMEERYYSDDHSIDLKDVAYCYLDAKEALDKVALLNSI